jgi:hypothetical protein
MRKCPSGGGKGGRAEVIKCNRAVRRSGESDASIGEGEVEKRFLRRVLYN